MWQIIGAGAIGCLWAANLKRNGQEVHLVTHSALSTNTLHYQDIAQQHIHFQLSCSQVLLNAIDPIILCVKATQVKQAIIDQRQRIGQQQVIILMHNGMGCAEQVQKLLPTNPIICATTANAALLHEPLNIQQTGLGDTFLGAFNQAGTHYEKIAAKLNAAIQHTFWDNKINQKLWLKIIINSCINPLTAINQIKNGQLLDPKYKSTLISINSECVQIANAEGIPFQEQELMNVINRVIKATAENFSSMNRDILFQRRTENEYINGYLLNKAHQHNIYVPNIESLYQRVKEAENISAVDNGKSH